MLGSGSVYQKEEFTGKVSGPCQCEDLLIIKPDESEMAGLKVKSHLESLMGTDVIKLNDREYMLSLQSRLMREYETVMDKQEELRSEKERRRQRRLYIEGLQELPNIDMKTPRGKSHHAGAGGTSKSSTSRHPDQRQSTLLNGSVDSDEDEDYFGHSPGNTPNPTRRKMKDVKTRRPTRYVKEPPKPSVGEESLALSLTTENRTARDRIEEDDEDLNTQRSLLMKQLRREKTVSGMYKTADLVLAAPVAELNYEAGPATGSPHGSLP